MAPATSKAVIAEKPVEVENTPVEIPELQNGDNQKLERVEKKAKKEKEEKKEKEATKEKKEKKEKKSTTADIAPETSEESAVKEKEKKSKKEKKDKKPKDTRVDEESSAAPPAVQSVANGTSIPKSKVIFFYLATLMKGKEEKSSYERRYS